MYTYEGAEKFLKPIDILRVHYFGVPILMAAQVRKMLANISETIARDDMCRFYFRGRKGVREICKMAVRRGRKLVYMCRSLTIVVPCLRTKIHVYIYDDRRIKIRSNSFDSLRLTDLTSLSRESRLSR